MCVRRTPLVVYLNPAWVSIPFCCGKLSAERNVQRNIYPSTLGSAPSSICIFRIYRCLIVIIYSNRTMCRRSKPKYCSVCKSRGEQSHGIISVSRWRPLFFSNYITLQSESVDTELTATYHGAIHRLEVHFNPQEKWKSKIIRIILLPILIGILQRVPYTTHQNEHTSMRQHTITHTSSLLILKFVGFNFKKFIKYGNIYYLRLETKLELWRFRMTNKHWWSDAHIYITQTE